MIIINTFACVFATIRAFGWSTNGVKRNKIIKFAEVGWFITLLLSIIYSFIQWRLLILAWFGSSFGTYVIATIVFRLTFRKIIKNI